MSFAWFPFSFEPPEARELIRVMAAYYRGETESVLFAERFGVDRLKVRPNLSPFHLWHELIELLSIEGTLRDAVQATHDEFPRNPRREFLARLLADQPALVSPEPEPDNGSATFDDSVTNDEALLFFDDLTIPAGSIANLVQTLLQMIRLSPSICLLRVEGLLQGSYYGSALRMSDKHVLTNHHVLFPKKQPAVRVQCDFGFDVDALGASLPVTSLPGDVATIKGEATDDWAIIEVPNMSASWPIVDLQANIKPKIGDATYILQHPGGQQKRLGFVRNTITHVDDGVIQYLTDTQPGSSGSPVFDAAGRVIALHHRGGTAVQVAGKPPVTKNQGVRISRIIERLRTLSIP